MIVHDTSAAGSSRAFQAVIVYVDDELTCKGGVAAKAVTTG